MPILAVFKIKISPEGFKRCLDKMSEAIAAMDRLSEGFEAAKAAAVAWRKLVHYPVNLNQEPYYRRFEKRNSRETQTKKPKK